MNSPTHDDIYLDPDEYPVGSQKRQERERELEELAAKQPPPVPESQWRGPDGA